MTVGDSLYDAEELVDEAEPKRMALDMQRVTAFLNK